MEIKKEKMSKEEFWKLVEEIFHKPLHEIKGPVVWKRKMKKK